MNKASKILRNTKLKWRGLRFLESLFYAMGAFVGVFLISNNVWVALVASLIIFMLVLILAWPWSINDDRVIQLFDNQIDIIENSASLIKKNDDQLSMIGRIQKIRIISLFSQQKLKVIIPQKIPIAVGFFILCSGFGLLIKSTFDIPELPKREGAGSEVVAELVNENPKESEKIKIQKIELTINPPRYSGLPMTVTEDLNIKALEGSRLIWRVFVNQPDAEVYLETIGNRKAKLKKSGDYYQISAALKERGFYFFNISPNSAESVTTEIYKLELIYDRAPEVAIQGIDQYTSFNHYENQEVKFNTSIIDDFGITDAYIIATVSKGSGESVKFREEKLAFDKELDGGNNLQNLPKSVNLKDLKMTPGDELYFYVEAWDNHRPERQKARTQTYFINIRDTTEVEFSLASSLGVDVMPEYFRSQRQIIIDTERLIKDKKKLGVHDFNSKSNELGFDQKSLRLKYGQFMGEEFESGLAIDNKELGVDVGSEEEDPLAEFSHDHDGDNEHNLIDEHDHEESEEEDPLETYMHDHDDPEEATLYTQSIRGKLKQAMAEMWDAELYLRLYQPDKSLPYQYRALELIKEIKNHARIYVHRIGFDPPPIKEDNRLSGDIKEIEDVLTSEQVEIKDPYRRLKECLALTAELLQSQYTISKKHTSIFESAGTELAGLAVEYPGKYLSTLEILKNLSDNEINDDDIQHTLRKLQASLIKIIPKSLANPSDQTSTYDELTRLYLQQLHGAN